MPTQNVKGGANKTGGLVDVAPHAGDDVLVSAEGAGAQNFAGFYDNTSIVVRLARALGGKALADSSAAGSLKGW